MVAKPLYDLMHKDNSFEGNLALAQRKDPKIVELCKNLESREDKYFELRNGIVYKKEDDLLLFYVPQDMEKSVLFRYHDNMGHIMNTFIHAVSVSPMPHLKERSKVI